MDNPKDILKDRLSETFGGETQEVTARKLNVTQGNVSKWVNGQQTPTVDTLRDISIIYQVSVDWLLGVSDQKELDGVALDLLTYEQAAKIIDRLIALGTLTIPNLPPLGDKDSGSYIGPGGGDPVLDSDYLKVDDRVLSYILRRRFKMNELGDDVLEFWHTRSLAAFHGLRLLSYGEGMQAAIDRHNWATFVDGDWAALVRQLGGPAGENRSARSGKSKKAEKDGKKDG